jgi:hypothetical protein
VSAHWLLLATGRGTPPSEHETQINRETKLHLALLRHKINSFAEKKTSGRYYQGLSSVQIIFQHNREQDCRHIKIYVRGNEMNMPV